MLIYIKLCVAKTYQFKLSFVILICRHGFVYCIFIAILYNIFTDFSMYWDTYKLKKNLILKLDSYKKNLVPIFKDTCLIVRIVRC